MIALRQLLIITSSIAVSGCAGLGTSLLEANPELRPGATVYPLADLRESRREFPASLGQLVQDAVEHNPSVRAAWYDWKRSIERVGSAGSLPDPTLAYTWLPLPVETRVGPNEHRLAFTQAIPSIPGLVAQHDAAEAMASAGRHLYEAAVLQVVTELKSLVADTRYHQRALLVVDTNLKLARQLAAAASQGLAADKGSLFDVSKARAQLAQLEYDRIRFRELLDDSRARLNALLARPIDAEVPTLTAWPITQLPADHRTLYRRALVNEPRLRAMDSGIRAGQAEVSRALGGYFPDIQLGAQYLINGPARAGNPTDSGADAVGLTVGLRIPLWFGKHQARVNEAEAALASRVEQKRDRVYSLLVRIKSELYRARNADRLLALYDETLLPEAQEAMKNAEAWYREGVGGYTDFLEARASFYQFSLARERSLADRLRAEAALERSIGQPLHAQTTKETP